VVADNVTVRRDHVDNVRDVVEVRSILLVQRSLTLPVDKMTMFIRRFVPQFKSIKHEPDDENERIRIHVINEN
jgi:hypothetical protein